MLFLQELEAKLSCQSNHNQSRVDFHQFHMVLYQFQQAMNEEFQSMKKIEEKEQAAGWDAGNRLMEQYLQDPAESTVHFAMA